MFVAALTDAVPELRGRVLADVAAVLPAAAGTPCSRLAPVPAWVLRFGLEGHDGSHHHHDDSGSYRRHGRADPSRRSSAGTAHHAVAILTILARPKRRSMVSRVDTVHFHEIGNWDSLMDVVAAAPSSRRWMPHGAHPTCRWARTGPHGARHAARAGSRHRAHPRGFRVAR